LGGVSLFKTFSISAAVVLVVGCQTPARESLASKCQFTECVCTLQKASVINKPTGAPVLWKDNGDAYCAEGYVVQSPAQTQARSVAEAKGV